MGLHDTPLHGACGRWEITTKANETIKLYPIFLFVGVCLCRCTARGTFFGGDFPFYYRPSGEDPAIDR